MAVSDWSITPAANATMPGINFAEGQLPSTVNNSNRQMMADLKSRFLSSAANVTDYAALSDGATDDTVAIAATLAATITKGGTVGFGANTTLGNLTLTTRNVRVRGAGRMASTFSPATTTGVAIRGLYNVGSWDAVTISDINLTGTGTLQGRGFVHGSDVKLATEEYTGRTIMTNVRFANLDKADVRLYGNIGQWRSFCQYEVANYHTYTADNTGSGDAMHGGNSVYTSNHYQGAAVVSDYLTSATTGTGQIVRRDLIREGNPGYCYYWNVVNTGGITPGGWIENEWNEVNYTSSTAVTVTHPNGTTDVAMPVWGKFVGVPSLQINNTPLGPLVLAAAPSGLTTNVTTFGCSLDNLTAITQDTSSTLFHDNARQYIGHAKGTVRSIGAVQNATALNAPAYSMPKPKGLFPYTANVVALFDAQSVIAYTGTVGGNTTLTTGDPGVPFVGNTQDMTITTGQTLFPSATFTIPAATWFVVQYVVRLARGPAVTAGINGNSGFGGFMINNAEYKCITQILANTGAAIANESMYHYGGVSSSVIRIAGLAVLSFTSAQSALEYANLGLFPAFDRPAYTLANVTASRTLDPTTATLVQTAQALATLIADLKLGRLPK